MEFEKKNGEKLTEVEIKNLKNMRKK